MGLRWFHWGGLGKRLVEKSGLGEAQRCMLLGQRRGVERSSRFSGPRVGDGLHMNEGIRSLVKNLQPLPRRICLQLLWNCYSGGWGCWERKEQVLRMQASHRLRREQPPARVAIPLGSPAGLCPRSPSLHFHPELLFLVNPTTFRGFKPYLHADRPHICISNSEPTPLPQEPSPSLTSCILPRISGRCLKLTISKTQLSLKPVCLLIVAISISITTHPVPQNQKPGRHLLLPPPN